MSEKLHHYVVVRKDLPGGIRLAQTIHAAGESALRPIPEGTHAYALEVPNEAELRRRAELLRMAGCPHVLIVEPDSPYDGQAMAIGLIPTTDKVRVGRVLGDLPLAR